MNKKKLRVLLTTSSGPGMAGIVHALKSHPLRETELLAGDVVAYETGAGLVSDVLVALPFANDAFYVDKMLSICERHCVDMILSGYSQENLILSQHISAFEAVGTKILTPPYANVAICQNKDEMLAALQEAGSPYAVPHYAARSVEEVISACAALGYPAKAVCVKPAVCNGGSRGFWILDENYDRHKAFFVDKDARRCTLDELLLKWKGIEDLPAVLVMEYIDGQEYGVDVVAKEGEMLAHVIREKLPPQMAGVDMRYKTAEDADISALADTLTRFFSLDSIVNMDIIRRGQSLYLLEINPRQGALIGGSALKCNLLAYAIDLLFGEAEDLARYETGYTAVTGVRYIEEYAVCDGQIVRFRK